MCKNPKKTVITEISVVGLNERMFFSNLIHNLVQWWEDHLSI